MHRRQYLAATGLALTSVVAGCSNSNGDAPNGDGTDGDAPNGDDSSPDGDSATDEPSTTRDESEAMAALRTDLEHRNVDIHNLFRDGSYIVLDYFTDAQNENDEALDEEIVAISRAFAKVVEEFDQDLETMECLALVDENTYVDIFEIQAAWAREYAAGDLSDEEYTQRIIDTLEYR